MTAKYLFLLLCCAALAALAVGGGHGGSHHKKVVIHVPYKVHHHHHKHTIVKHIHHKAPSGGDDHYEVLGYTYGQAKPAPHAGGGHGWHVADETEDHDSPVSFQGEGGYDVSGAADYGESEGYSEHGY